MSRYEHSNAEACKMSGDHMMCCDRDGYCMSCGEITPWGDPWPAPTGDPISPADIFPALYEEAADILYSVKRGWDHDETASAVIKRYFKTYEDMEDEVPIVWSNLFPNEFYEALDEREKFGRFC